jgi:CubicO group peptidase (beta-lactamase class C family)
VENSVSVTPDTVFRLGSISKPVTAVAALKLAAKGKLDLDAPVQRYIPDFPKKPWPITTRQLLGHLGGIRHYRGPDEFGSTRHYGDLRSPLKIFDSDPLVAEPGAKFVYTTYGYVLIGAVIESAAGQPFVDFLTRNIFAPAGILHMQADDAFAIIRHRARGYRISSGGVLENCAFADTSNKIPGGGLSSTATDIVRFALAVREGKYFTAETMKLMFAPQRLNDGKQTQYGLGWNILRDANAELVGHGGGQQGVATFLLMDAAKGDVVALMANLEGARVDAIALQILRILREET